MESRSNSRWLIEVKNKLEEADFKVRIRENGLVIDEPIPNLVPCQEHRIWLDDRGYLHISVWFTTPEWEEAQGTDEVERVLRDIEDVHIRNLMSFFELFHVLECDVFEDVEEEDIIEYSLDARFGLVAPEKIVEVMRFLREKTEEKVREQGSLRY